MQILADNTKFYSPKNTALKVSKLATQKIGDIGVDYSDSLQDIAIGKFVQKTLREMFNNEEVSPEEVELMQTESYSKETFDIQYPLLVKTSLSDGKKPVRFWAKGVQIFGENYYICSEWYETENNNDREYFMKWLTLRGGPRA